MLVPDIAFTLKDYVEDPLEEASILLSNITTGNVDSQAWALFINGVPDITATTKDFIVTYSSGEEYVVTLTVAETGGEDYSINRIFLILDGEVWELFRTIMDMVRFALGDALNWDYIRLIKAKYQELLCPALEDSFVDLDFGENVDICYDERFWPHLANLLISYLIIRDLITVDLNKSIAGSSGGGGGEVTRIITGPTEVHFNAPSGTLAASFKEGFYDLIQGQLCALSSRLKVLVSGCPKPIITPKRLDTEYTGYPAWEIILTNTISQA